MWSTRADAAIMHISVPWKGLLEGISPDSLLTLDGIGLAQYYASKQLALTVMIDVTDGLNRAAEAPELVTLGRSITEPAVQALYRQFARAVATRLSPDYLGLAAETNLIRVAAPASVYQAVVAMTNAASTELRAQGTTAKLFVSVQVETAWGRLQGSNQYEGVEQDFRDFPFHPGARPLVVSVPRGVRRAGADPARLFHPGARVARHPDAAGRGRVGVGIGGRIHLVAREAVALPAPPSRGWSTRRGCYAGFS